MVRVFSRHGCCRHPCARSTYVTPKSLADNLSLTSSPRELTAQDALPLGVDASLADHKPASNCYPYDRMRSAIARGRASVRLSPEFAMFGKVLPACGALSLQPATDH